MLSSRYLHLHEALGLGPMWFKRGAKVLPAAEPAPAAMPAPPAAAAPQTAISATAPVETATAPAPAPSANAQQARLAAMAAVGGHSAARSDGLNAVQQPSEKAAAPAVETAQAATTDKADWLHTLAERIPRARVLVAAICPAPEDSASGQLFSGDVGVLLDNMLAAIDLRAADAHKTSWVQDAPVFSPQPAAADIRAALPRMQAELALSQAEAVLLLGQIFEKPEQAEAIAELCSNVPCFVIPHPARLLRQPQLKAQAWQELKKLRRVLDK